MWYKDAKGKGKPYRRDAEELHHVEEDIPLRSLRLQMIRFHDDESGSKPTRSQMKLLRLDHDSKFNNFFKNIGAVSTLGASITFVLISVELADPKDISRKLYFNMSTVRIFLSISWLLFMITLGLSFFLAGMIKARNDDSMWDRVDAVSAALLYVLILCSVLFLGLVVAAYVAWVGFIAAALSGLLAVVICIPLIICQWPWDYLIILLVGSGN